MEIKEKNYNITSCFSCENNDYKYIITPLFCNIKNKINDDNKIISPIYCRIENENDSCICTPFFCNKLNKKEKNVCILSPICCNYMSKKTYAMFTPAFFDIEKNDRKFYCLLCTSFSCKNCYVDPFMLDIFFSVEKFPNLFDEYENVCTLCICQCSRIKYLNGETKSKEINEYIKENKLRSQKVKYKITPISFKLKGEPPIQKMTDNEVSDIINKEILKEHIFENFEIGDGKNISNLIMEY
jgi:hypothetical protein